MVEKDSSLDHYVIRGGEAGKKRLDLLARVMEPYTKALLDRMGVGPGARFLDLGCGAGHVSLEAARRVGPQGSVTGVDLDETKLDLARRAATGQGLRNLSFLHGNASEIVETGSYDFAYSRFLLTHLSDPAGILGVMHETLKPGAVIAVEDIDVSGAFCYPENPHFDRLCELYSEAVRRNGADPDIAPKLPSLLRQAGFEAIQAHLVQPLYLEGELKEIMLATLRNISDAVVGAGLATEHDLDQTIQGLASFTADPTTLVAMPRIIQTWGVRPG